jgi:uncharacterized RDD family membrane protein YckC
LQSNTQGKRWTSRSGISYDTSKLGTLKLISEAKKIQDVIAGFGVVCHIEDVKVQTNDSTGYSKADNADDESTSKHEEQSMVLASQWQRFGNFCLDMIFFYIFAYFFAYPIGFILGFIGLGDFFSHNTFFPGVVLIVIYYVPQEAFNGRTLGKLITGTKAVNEDGTELSFGQAVKRNILRCVPFEAFTFLGYKGGPMPIRFHDKFSGTKVISLKMVDNDASSNTSHEREESKSNSYSSAKQEEKRSGYSNNQAPPRFTDNRNGTVTDNLTGLVWLKDATCFGKMTWHEAISNVNKLSSGYCCLTDGSKPLDWRLPNINEIKHFANRIKTDNPFTNEQSSFYWSSTISLGDTSGAWVVLMFDSYVTYVDESSHNNYMWPVRIRA